VPDAPWISVRARPGATADSAGGTLARSALAEALFAAGAQGVHEDGDRLVTHFPPGTDLAAVRVHLERADADVAIEVGEVAPVDWSEAWRGAREAQVLGALTITPPWLADRHDPARSVVIDPGMAFGTGEHGTTRGVVRLLEQVVRPGDHVADLGAGSGVLAIAAARLGAARVYAIELDPEAIPNAEENVRRNGVAAVVHVFEGDAAVLLPLVAPVRVVLANIISSVLEPLLPVIGAALPPDGAAILSGLLQDERPRLLAVLEAGGWCVTDEDAEDIWWTVAIARRLPPAR
jgi:ribosomal protein L11 methyltransferase